MNSDLINLTGTSLLFNEILILKDTVVEHAKTYTFCMYYKNSV